MKFLVLLLLVLSSVMVGSVYATETRCATVYLKLMNEIETAKKVEGNPCLEADAYERILNWIGMGEIECADMPNQAVEDGSANPVRSFAAHLTAANML
jgi:hypothetical protein